MPKKYLRCLSVSRPDHRIEFDLCSPSEDVESHVSYALNNVLSMRQYKEHDFKFGISAQPAIRWTAFADYKFLDLMVVVFTSENSDDTANLEKQVILKHRSDNRLQNVKPGGENAHCGVSPHFLYIVFGKSHQFARGRNLASAR